MERSMCSICKRRRRHQNDGIGGRIIEIQFLEFITFKFGYFCRNLMILSYFCSFFVSVGLQKAVVRIRWERKKVRNMNLSRVNWLDPKQTGYSVGLNSSLTNCFIPNIIYENEMCARAEITSFKYKAILFRFSGHWCSTYNDFIQRFNC